MQYLLLWLFFISDSMIIDKSKNTHKTFYENMKTMQYTSNYDISSVRVLHLKHHATILSI